MRYIELAKLHQLFDGFSQPINLGGQQLLLLQEEGQRYLIANRCPHQGAPLHRATLLGDRLRCPAHGIEFDLRTGMAVNNPDCGARLVYYPLAYEGNTLGVYLD